MNKDALLATLIGLGLGLAVTGIFILGPQLVKSLPHISLPKITLPQTKPQKQITATPTPTPIVFSVSSPLPESIELSDQLVVSGTAPADSLVVVQGAVDDDVIRVNGDGKYAAKVTLAEGKNDLVVTNYVSEKNAMQTVTVYYTPENL